MAILAIAVHAEPMPKPTFLNLPDDKRERITELALDEFSTHPYRQASLSRIVARAGIAKGSMYQYFENKLDLYRWLVTDELERRRLEWLQTNAVEPANSEPANSEPANSEPANSEPANSEPANSEPANNSGTGLFAELEHMVLTRVGFMLAHPRLARLAANAMEPTADEELRELHSALRREQVDGLAARISAAQTLGEVRSSVDPRSLAHFLDALIMRGTTNAVLERLGVEVHQFLVDGASGRFEEAQWRALVQQALGLIRVGIQATVGEATAGPDAASRLTAVADERRLA
jgi:AcrR family transcriptional regulator